MSNHSDLLIIGAGPGGYETAARAADDGMTVRLIERAELGGTCLNRGCIPTKCLCKSAEVIDTVNDATRFGVTVDSFSINFGTAIARARHVVETLRDGIRQTLGKVDIVKGVARFTAPHQVSVDNCEYTADKIIIATGSTPARLPIEGAGLALTSDEVLASDTLPASAIIIGGGVIGMEMACILAAFGTAVTVIEYCKEILPGFDRDIARRLHSQLSRRDKAPDILTSATVKSIRRTSPCALQVTFDSKKGEQHLEAEQVIMAVGRRPTIPEGCNEVGIKSDSKGIVTDNNLCTSVENVYAIGDCNGRCMLAHAASAQGRVVLGHDINLNIIPSAVFTVPELAMAGLSEEQCKEAGKKYSVGKAMFGANGKALSIGEPTGLAKIIYDSMTGEIYGAHILGPHAADLIQEAATAMASGLGVQAIARAVHPHPTLVEIMSAAVPHKL